MLIIDLKNPNLDIIDFKDNLNLDIDYNLNVEERVIKMLLTMR